MLLEEGNNKTSSIPEAQEIHHYVRRGDHAECGGCVNYDWEEHKGLETVHQSGGIVLVSLIPPCECFQHIARQHTLER